MSHTANKIPLFGLGIVLLVGSIVTIPFVVQYRQDLPIFDLRFNPFALLSLLGLVADIAVVSLLVRRQRKTFDSLWLIAALSAVIVFALSEALQRLSAQPEGAVFWAQLAGIGVAFMTAFYFLFAVSYTQPGGQPNGLMTSCVLIGAAVIAFFHANGNIFYLTNLSAVHSYPWGYNNDIGPGFIANVLWFALLYFLAVVLLFRFRQKTANKVLRSQATIFIVATAFPVVGGIIFDSLLPLLGIESLPPLGLLLATINAILLVVGIYKYRVFELSPAILSQNILTTMSEAVIVTNEDLEIEFFNAEAGQLLGSGNSITSRPLTEFFSNDQRLTKLRDQLLAGGDLTSIEPIEDMSLTHDNGAKQYLRILVSPVGRQHNVEGFIFVISDVTELQQAYIELAAAKAGVERVVAERTRELRTAQQKLLETDKLKTEFIMLASHNLRTPLASIRGYLELMELSNLDGTQKNAIENLKLSSGRLSSLIDDLLTISTIEAGQQNMERTLVSAADMLHAVCAEAETVAHTTHNTFDVQIAVTDARILASTDRLKAAVNNILDNAFKFTSGGHVTFKASAHDGKLRIIISDSGIGIKAEELPKLFTKFHRGTDALHFQYEGRGLGLYLAKLIINEHDGAIDIDSDEGKGTIVTITIPLANTPPVAHEQPFQSAHAA